MGKSVKDQMSQAEYQKVFILFKIISELENIKQDDVKDEARDEAREKHLKTELHDLELLEESAMAKRGKLSPIKPGEKGLQKLPCLYTL